MQSGMLHISWPKLRGQIESSNHSMPYPDLAEMERNYEPIVKGIGRESVQVYLFLSREFSLGPIDENHVFQFLFRSFYRLDNAGLTPEFKVRYFELLEQNRDAPRLDLEGLVRDLRGLPNRRGRQTLQFSFATKLANTVNPEFPIYDAEVAGVFGFRPPDSHKTFDARLSEYLIFYEQLKDTYTRILRSDVLAAARGMFATLYMRSDQKIPPIKVLDFLFWSAGKLSYRADERNS